jgi:hypothetical protein
MAAGAKHEPLTSGGNAVPGTAARPVTRGHGMPCPYEGEGKFKGESTAGSGCATRLEAHRQDCLCYPEISSPLQLARRDDLASSRGPARRGWRRRACQKCEKDNCGRFLVGRGMDRTASGDQLLFFDCVFGIVGMVWNVGRATAVFDFGSGKPCRTDS